MKPTGCVSNIVASNVPSTEYIARKLVHVAPRVVKRGTAAVAPLRPGPSQDIRSGIVMGIDLCVSTSCPSVWK
jgi:hypothetical protein